MRHLLVLPGSSPKNRAWGELMLSEYEPQFESSHMLAYDHWANGDSTIDFAREEAKIKTHTAALPTGTEIVLFAKSAGSLLAFLAIAQGAISPSRCVFFGIPFDLAADSIFKDSWAAVTDFSVPTIAFHNLEDPTTRYEFTRDMLAQHAPHITLVTTHESDHWYGDTTTYSTPIQLLLSSKLSDV